MITLDAFLVFLAAASLPATYIFLMSRWIEPEYRKTHDSLKKEPAISTSNLIREIA